MDEELKRKLLFTLLAVFIYRVGAHIAAPGVNVAALQAFISNSGAQGFFNLYDTLGGGLFRATVQMVSSVKNNVISVGGVVILILVAVGAIASVVAMTIAARRIPIQIPRKVMGRGRIREGQKTFIPIRLITAGVMPIVFAQTI